MKNHLKRIASPRTWIINRKQNVFITRPKPGAHPLNAGMALGVILRDKLGLVSTMSEAKKVLNNQEILIDGKRKKDYRLIVGLFDVLSVPSLKQQFRVALDKKGRLVVNPIAAQEATFKICKVVGKSVLAKNKIQLNLHDGKNIISSEKVKVGDSLVLELPTLKIKEALPLNKDVAVFLTKGKHAGALGVLKEIQDQEAIFTVGKEEIETAKQYLFVVGKKESLIKLNDQK
jgi:small subunit ribosomal protein S4e